MGGFPIVINNFTNNHNSIVINTVSYLTKVIEGEKKSVTDYIFPGARFRIKIISIKTIHKSQN